MCAASTQLAIETATPTESDSRWLHTNAPAPGKHASACYYMCCSAYYSMRPHTTTCVLILLHASSYHYMRPHTTTCVLILLHAFSYCSMRPDTTRRSMRRHVVDAYISRWLHTSAPAPGKIAHTMCPHTTIPMYYVSAYYYMYVSHTLCVYVSHTLCVRILLYLCALIPLYMRPHTTIYVSSCCCMRVLVFAGVCMTSVVVAVVAARNLRSVCVCVCVCVYLCGGGCSPCT